MYVQFSQYGLADTTRAMESDHSCQAIAVPTGSSSSSSSSSSARPSTNKTSEERCLNQCDNAFTPDDTTPHAQCIDWRRDATRSWAVEAEHGRWAAHDLVHRSLQAAGGRDNVVVHLLQDAVHRQKLTAPAG